MKTMHEIFDGSAAQELGPEYTGWQVTGKGHVIPNHDLRDHIESAECWCDPMEDDSVTVHHSADGRELVERGERKAS